MPDYHKAQDSTGFCRTDYVIANSIPTYGHSPYENEQSNAYSEVHSRCTLSSLHIYLRIVSLHWAHEGADLLEGNIIKRGVGGPDEVYVPLMVPRVLACQA